MCNSEYPFPPVDRPIVLPPHAAAQHVTHGVVRGNAGMAPCQPLTHPSVSEIWVSFCVTVRSISRAYRVQSNFAFALMYYILRSRSSVHCALGINPKLSMMCLFTVCFREFSAMLRCTQVQHGHLQLVKCSTACFEAASTFSRCMSAMSF